MTVSRDHYYKLASEVPEERIEAAKALLSELLAENVDAEWDYALNRLIKGLTSTRQSARYGFSMALTEVVRELVLRDSYDLTVESYVDKLVEASRVSSSMKGSMVRSLLFGRLFGLQALINSKLLLDPKASSPETLVRFIGALVQLSGIKSWLRETAMYSMCQFVTEYLKSDFCTDETTVSFLQSICDEGLAFTTEGLAVYMCIPPAKLPVLCDQLRTSSQWKNGHPLNKGNMATLAKVLKDSEIVDKLEDGEGEDTKAPKMSKNGKQKGSWSSKVPFVWEYILAYYSAADEQDDDFVESGEKSKKRKKSSTQAKKKAKADTVESIPFQEFWKSAVDDTLFGERSSPERKYWGIDIFIRFLVSMPASSIQHIFTPNLLRCLALSSTQKNQLLNKFSKKALNTIMETCHKDLSKLVPSIHAIIDENAGAHWNLDISSKIRVIDSLVGVLNHVKDVNSLGDYSAEELVSEIFDTLQSRYKSALKSQKEMSLHGEAVQKYSNDSLLKWVMDKMLVLFRSCKKLDTPPVKVMEDFVKFILLQGYFKSVNGPTVAPNVQTFAQDKLSLFLGEYISVKRKDHSWSLYCVKQIEKLGKKDETELSLAITGELATIKDETLEILDKIKKAMKNEPAKKNQYYCFELLFSMVLLQLYVGEPEAVSVLEDLKVSYLSATGDENEDVDSSVIITEIILSFIARKSTLLKRISNLVWELFICKAIDGELNVNKECFKRLFAVLAASENVEGQKSLFEGDGEFGASEDDDESEGDDEGESADDEGESDKEDTEVGNVSQIEVVEKETKTKLANALGIPEYDGEVKFEDIDSFGEDDDNYESESMDDEQMMAIDGELSRIFKERVNALTANNKNVRKAEETQAKDQVLLFKNRVLDLMDTFLKLQPNSLFGLSFLRPLVKLINSTKNKDLGVKAHKLLKAKVSRVKPSGADIARAYPSAEEQEAFCAGLLEEIEWFQNQASSKSRNNSHRGACGQSCIILARCLISINKEYLPKVIAIYSSSMTEWAMNPKNKLPASNFFDFINWLNDKRA